MTKRYSAFGNLLSDIYRRQVEANYGRIDFAAGLWEWVQEELPAEAAAHFQAGGGGNLYKYNKTEGRFYRLVRGPSVTCPNPAYTTAEYVPNERGGHYVPSKVCKKCEHYRKGLPRAPRYPTCAYRREDNPESKAAASVVEVFVKAKEFADDVLGGA